jgi:cytoskeletal protein RodZ
MNRFVQSIRHHINAALDHVGLFFPLGTMELLWIFGAVVALIPATAYTWWHHNPVAFSVTANDQDARHTMPSVEQPAPDKIDAAPHADTGGSDAVSDDTSRSQTAGNTQVNTQLNINGEAIPLPSQGTVHREISTPNGNASVDVSTSSATSDASGSHSHTSLNIELNSSSKAENTDVDQ